MRASRGFVMGVVLFSLLALSLAGATAVLRSSSEVDMVSAFKQQRQLAACAQAGATVAASNMRPAERSSNSFRNACSPQSRNDFRTRSACSVSGGKG